MGVQYSGSMSVHGGLEMEVQVLVSGVMKRSSLGRTC